MRPCCSRGDWRCTALLHIIILIYSCDHYSTVIVVNYCILSVSFLFYCKSKKLQQQCSWSYDMFCEFHKAFQNAPKCTILEAKVQKFSGEGAVPLPKIPPRVGRGTTLPTSHRLVAALNPIPSSKNLTMPLTTSRNWIIR